jgi:hypothetical protein
MALTVSDLKNQVARLHKTSTKVREQAEKMMGVAINTVETAGSAAFLAYMRGRYPSDVTETNAATGAKTTKPGTDLLVAGIPVSLLVGVAGHVAGFTGMLGKYSEHGHALGTGGLAEYAVSTLWKIGDTARVDALKASGKSATPVTPVVKGAFATQNRVQGQYGGMGMPQPYAQPYAGHMASMFG